MGNYTEREVKTSIRRLNGAINDVVSASYATYKSKIESFVELSHSDSVIKSIVDPFRAIDVDLNKVHGDSANGWIHEVKLPADVNERIAYIVKIFDGVAARKLSLDSLTHSIFKHKRFEDNIRDYLSDIARPQLRELIYMLDDLIEDEVQGQQTIPESALQIINHGTITAQHGSSIALGKDIQQTINNNNVSNEIMEKIREEGILSEEKYPEVEILSNEVQEVLKMPEPSPGRLKELAGKVYEAGEQALLKTFTCVISDPRWGQAAAETLLNM